MPTSVPTDFYKTDLTTANVEDDAVPGIWELNGYGDPEYVNIGFAWRYQFKTTTSTKAGSRSMPLRRADKRTTTSVPTAATSTLPASGTASRSSPTSAA
jgi:uncharacterized protein with WD repeat